METLNLTEIPVVDEHCHGFYQLQQPDDTTEWHRHFTESRNAGIWREAVVSTLIYSRLLRELAQFFDCQPLESAVLEARSRYDSTDLIRRLLQDGNIEALLVDQGYPPAGQLIPDATIGAVTASRVAPLLRLETLMQQLIVEHDSLSAVTESLQIALADIRASGYAGLKSIVAYRTGLDIRWWDTASSEASFTEARKAITENTLRLAHKPLLDTLLHIAFTEAARQEVPVQFHTGYGDTDVDLVMANPLYLRGVLEHSPYRGMPVVLLHECYPYTRQGGYLAAVYENVYLDLSYAIPFLSYEEMVSFTRAAMGVAPLSKLLYSSDAVGIPELHWISALDGRRVLGQVLAETIANGDLTVIGAEAAARAVLHDTAIRLYRL